MTGSLSMQGDLLIAMPSLECPFFSGSLVYLLEHGEEGAMGLIINRPLEVSHREILEQINPSPTGSHDEPIYCGGPVGTDRGFVLHRPDPGHEWKNQVHLTSRLAMTTSTDILRYVSEGNHVDIYLIAVGYSGWGPGQLETEIAENSWLTVTTDPVEILLLPSAQRLHAAAGKLGIDYRLLPSSAGHG